MINMLFSLTKLAHPIRFERVISAFGGVGRMTIDQARTEAKNNLLKFKTQPLSV